MKEILLIAAVICTMAWFAFTNGQEEKAAFWVRGESFTNPIHCMQCGEVLHRGVYNGVLEARCDFCGMRLSLGTNPK